MYTKQQAQHAKAALAQRQATLTAWALYKATRPVAQQPQPAKRGLAYLVACLLRAKQA